MITFLDSTGTKHQLTKRVQHHTSPRGGNFRLAVDLDDEDDGLELPLDDDGPVGSVRFVGTDEMDPRIELFADERGRQFDLLDLYRHGRVDGLALFRDAVSQLEAAGCR